jgi:hypothetical protein
MACKQYGMLNGSLEPKICIVFDWISYFIILYNTTGWLLSKLLGVLLNKETEVQHTNLGILLSAFVGWYIDCNKTLS